ncbi:MAG TPA: hypothetical protein VGQ09_20370 [Chitinophagaceae bacterium]|nr:hypothetical protein [Chitinophagaceae bacterium]
MLLTHKDILLQLEKIETKLTGHDEDIQLIFKYLKQLLNPPQQPRKKTYLLAGRLALEEIMKNKPSIFIHCLRVLFLLLLPFYFSIFITVQNPSRLGEFKHMIVNSEVINF